MTQGALEGVRVLDVAGPIAAYCTRILADLGADVVLIEPPGGDRLRRVPPFADGAEVGGDSLLFCYYHAGQQAVTIDMDSDDGRRRLEILGAAADVVLISPSARQPLPGWDRASKRLLWAAEEAVVCALTPFGLTGPFRDWRATAFTSFAMGGSMIRAGPPDGPPVTIPGRQQWDEAGVHAALAILAALHARPRAGGQLIDLAVHELAVMRDFVIERYSATGMDPAGRAVSIGIPPSGTYQCADGPFDVAAHQLRHWDAFLEMLGNPDELSEPSLADPMIRRHVFDGLLEVIDRLVVTRSRQELVERGQRAGLPCSLQHTPTAFVSDPQPAARNAFVLTPLPGGGAMRAPGPGFRAQPPLTVDRWRRQGAPAAGEAADPGWIPRVSASSQRSGAVAGGPLAGVRVLTFGAFVAGTFVGCLLAELGADVVKIEARSHPEVVRMPVYALGPPCTEPSGVPNNLMYASLNRSVRNISIEMGSEAGRDLFRRLVAHADIVIENFRAGVLARWGCGFDALMQVNPSLVLTSVSGYGRTGPRARYLAYGTNIASFTALTHCWGHSHATHSDYLGGEHAALATLAALRWAQATGQGVHVDVAQTEALAAVMPEILLEALVNGRDPPARGNAVAGSLLSGVYRAVGHDAWLAIELEDLDDWNRICSVTGREDLLARAEADAHRRRVALDAAIETWCARWTSHTAVHHLQRAGIAAGVVQTAEDVWRDPQLRSRGSVVELDQPDLGPYDYWANPYRFSVTAPGPSSAGARLGGHTKKVLREWLGMDPDEIDALIEGGVAFQG